MCWSSAIAIPIVLKKPLKVYKVGTVTSLGNFISLYQTFWYYKHKILPTIKLNPAFKRSYPNGWHSSAIWIYDTFYWIIADE